MNFAYINGVKCEDLNVVSLYNPTFLYGVNCFEGIRAYWNSDLDNLVFLDLEAHLKRLYDSAERLSLDEPVSLPALEEHIRDIVEREGVREDVYIRVTFFIGGDGSWYTTEGIDRLVSVRSQPRMLGQHAPVRLGISTVRRITETSMPPQVKAGANYLNSRYALLEVQGRGFDDALLLTVDGVVSEATGSTVFFIEGDCLITPSVDSDLLRGITRERILSHCRDLGVLVAERRVDPDEIRGFEAAFVVGSAVEMKEVGSIDDQEMAIGHPLYRRLVQDFSARIDAGII